MSRETKHHELDVTCQEAIFDAFVKITQARPGDSIVDIAREVKQAYLHIFDLDESHEVKNPELELIRQALEKARLALEWANGCFLTDRPDLLRSVDEKTPLDDILWKGIQKDELALIEQALKTLDQLGGVNNTSTDP